MTSRMLISNLSKVFFAWLQASIDLSKTVQFILYLEENIIALKGNGPAPRKIVLSGFFPLVETNA